MFVTTSPLSVSLTRPIVTGTVLNDIIEEYVQEKISLRRCNTRHTKTNLVQQLYAFAAWLVTEHGVTDPAYITRRHCVAWYQHALSLPLSTNTVRPYVAVPFTWLAWCHALGHIDSNPAVLMPRVQPVRVQLSSTTPADLAAVLQRCDTWRELVIVSLVSLYGLRRLELVTSDIDADGRLVVYGKHGKPRLVPLPPVGAFADVLTAYHANYRTETAGPVLYSTRRARLSPRRADVLRVRAVLDHYGDGSLHRFRRGCATHGVSSGAFDDTTMAHLLGHTIKNVTSHYRAACTDDLAARLQLHPFFPVVDAACRDWLNKIEQGERKKFA